MNIKKETKNTIKIAGKWYNKKTGKELRRKNARERRRKNEENYRFERPKITKYNYNKIYLSSNHWNKRRKRYWASHPDSVCFCCGEKPELLHHITYDFLFREKDKHLVPLCEACHTEVHDLIYTDNTKTINYSNAHIYYKRLKRINDNLFLPEF